MNSFYSANIEPPLNSAYNSYEYIIHRPGMYVEPYSPIVDVSTGKWLYGCAAFAHRIKQAGGFHKFIEPLLQSAYLQGYQANSWTLQYYLQAVYQYCYSQYQRYYDPVYQMYYFQLVHIYQQYLYYQPIYVPTYQTVNYHYTMPTPTYINTGVF